jgi:spermidine synthase
MQKRWICEEDQGLRTCHKIKKQLLHKKTTYQEIQIFDSINFGKILVIDGIVQLSTSDEHLYHEALVHPIALTHPNPKTALILGGGDGATLREILGYNVIEKVEIVEIDLEVIKYCRKFLPELMKNAFEDPRVQIICDDAKRYLEGTKRKYDLIIQDLTDPLPHSPSEQLYTVEHFQQVHARLNEDGLFVTQATTLYPNCMIFATIYNTLRQVFPVVRAYSTYIPSYAGIEGFIIGSKKYDPVKLSRKTIESRILKRKLGDLKWYEAPTHKAAFTIPKEIRTTLENTSQISTKKLPVNYKK